MARRRFQRGSVFKNRAKTVWLGAYSERVLDSDGVERRNRRQIILGPIRRSDGSEMTKREAQHILLPYVVRVNSSLSVQHTKSITFEEFAKIWVRDYLSTSKPSTQATMRGQVKKLVAAFGKKTMQEVGAGDLQRIIAGMVNYAPKTVRNLWAIVRLIWKAALDQGYVDRVLPKPKLPRTAKKKPRYYRLADVAKIITASPLVEFQAFYWLAAETGLRAGELSGLRLVDVAPNSITVNQSVWNGKTGTPKTQNSVREIAVSPQLTSLLSEQIGRQKTKGHFYLFSTATGSAWDMNLFRKRRMQPLLRLLKIQQAGLHAFRHFNSSLLGTLRVPLKTIQERLGHAMTGSLTLDVYTHTEWKENEEAARLAGEAIGKAVNSVCLTAIQEEGLPTGESEALEAA